jgi:hypothetical protein
MMAKLLYDPKTEHTFSADKGDYFMFTPDKKIKGMYLIESIPSKGKIIVNDRLWKITNRHPKVKDLI